MKLLRLHHNKNFLLITLLSFYLLSCSDKKEFWVEDTIKRIDPLNDHSHPLSDIAFFEKFSNDSLIIVSDRITLFINHKFVRQIGNKGNGYGEYELPYSIKQMGQDTLMVFDRMLSKILFYSISTGTCLREIINKDFYKFTQANYTNNTHYFLLTTLSKALPTTTPLLYSITKDTTKSEFLNLKLSDIDSELVLTSPINVKSSKNFIEKNGIFYFFFPLIPKIWLYDLQKHQNKSFSLPLDLDISKFSSKKTTLSDKLKVIEGSEVVIDLYLLSKNIAIVTRQGKSPHIKYRIRFLSYEGEYLCDTHVSERVIEVNDQEYWCLSLDMSGQNLINPYSLIKHNYTIRGK